MSNCYHINPLQHNGTSRSRRLLAALQPSGAPIDGRSLADLLLFAEQYATLINFYDNNNTINGDWKNFLSNDITTILSAITIVDYQKPLATFYKYFNTIETVGSNAEIETILKLLFDVCFSLLNEIRAWNNSLLLKTDAKDMIIGEINSHLCYALYDLTRYFVQTESLSFFNLIVAPIQPATETYKFLHSQKIIAEDFKPEWLTQFTFPNNGLRNIVHKLKANNVFLGDAAKIFGDAGWGTRSRLLYASAFLQSIFTTVYNSYVRIITSSQNYFTQSIEQYPYHNANNGLMIAFFRLFGIEQNALNAYTDKHLNFYYNKVLKIDTKPAVPDSLHIVFTLAKNVKSYLLKAGTKLFAGKDALKKELIYQTDKTIALNKGIITSLRSVFFDEDTVAGGLFAADVANSLDGKGKPLTPDALSWYAYGQPQSGIADDSKKTMTTAAIGFIIASPVLLLSEGKRAITITMSTIAGNLTQQGLSSGDLISKLTVAVTGKKGWITTNELNSSNIASADNAVNIDTTNNKITLKFILDESIGGIVAFHEKIHKANYPTTSPAVKIMLDQNAETAFYRSLSKVRISSIKINVQVQNAQSCIIASDSGSLDNQNPFVPFGPRPKLGFSFYFGSQEVFSKYVTQLVLHFNWLGLPATDLYTYYAYQNNATTNNANYITIPDDSSKSFTINPHILKVGKYQSCTADKTSLFNFSNNATPVTAQDITLSNLFTAAEGADPVMDSFTSYSPQLKRGFLQLTINSPSLAFGHDAYVKVFTQQVIEVNKDSGKYSLPNEPYTPLLSPLKYDYNAEATIGFGSAYNINNGQFFQLFPFGYDELSDNNSPVLLQPFKDADILLQGALFIGIQFINVAEQLNLYLEMNEGSEDASIDPLGISWCYLSNNEWKTLTPFLLSDTTNQMLGSGIISFSIPEDMNDDNTLMPSATRWIRAGVQDNNYTAYPEMFAVFTNAVTATFADNSNDPGHLADPLPAQKINKLYSANAVIKQVLQPYASFDGRMRESGQPYYNRISERLRHKNRAITIWDYERLILERFNFLYKAKCLNHTSDDTETAPGCVRIITVPNVNPDAGGNLFEPMISNNRRSTIKQYITKLNCPFVWLEVENPQYENIRVNSQVKFYDDSLFIEYSKQLKTDISQFLAPWAFQQDTPIDFGGSIDGSVIIKFIEDLDYVDYLTDFSMDLLINNAVVLSTVAAVQATTSKSILTSYTDHNIGNKPCMI